MNDPGLLGWLLRYVREHGDVPEGAQVYVDGVELKSTGDELLDALGFRDADVKIAVRATTQRRDDRAHDYEGQPAMSIRRYRFHKPAGENGWDAVRRLADEVGWDIQFDDPAIERCALTPPKSAPSLAPR